jgi:branched-subunit amino acid ABC-type transport system permease component
VTDLITTINLAAIYGLIGVGISLTWAGLGFLNLAHGVTFAAAGYGAWWAQENINGHPSVIFLGGIIVGAVAGAIICISVFLPLDGKINWPFRSMVASLGLAIIGVNVYLLVFGPSRKSIDFLFGTTKFKVGDTTITATKSGAIISATVVMVLVVVALTKSRMGLGVRALTQNPEGAALVGIGRKQAAFAILITSGGAALTDVLSRAEHRVPAAREGPDRRPARWARERPRDGDRRAARRGHGGRDDPLSRRELGAPDPVRADRHRLAGAASRRRGDPGGVPCVAC